MIIIPMAFTALTFFLSGMLTSAICVNRAEGRTSSWNLYAFAVLNFLFGLYYLVALVGASSKI